MEQQAANVWRKRAFSAMKAAHDQFARDAKGSDRLLGCLDTFRERVDHSVENTVPVGKVSFSSRVLETPCVVCQAHCMDETHPAMGAFRVLC